MALRTEGVGRGVNWQGLSNLANIIQRGGETQAEIFRGIGEGIVKRRQFKEQMAAEQKRADEARAFNMASLMAQMGERAEARERSQKQFDVTTALERQKLEDARLRDQAANQRAAEDNARRRAEWQLEAAQLYAQHGIKMKDPFAVERSKEALKSIIPEMMRAATKRAMPSPDAAIDAVLKRIGDISAPAYSVEEPKAPSIAMPEPKGPSAALSQQFNVWNSLDFTKFDERDANSIIAEVGSASVSAARDIDNLTNEVESLRMMPRTPKVASALALKERQLRQATIDRAFAESSAVQLQRGIAAAQNERRANAVAGRNSELRRLATPDTEAFINAFIADPSNDKYDTDDVLKLLDNETRRRVLDPERRIGAAQEAVYRSTARRVNDYMESMPDIDMTKPAKEIEKQRMEHMRRNISLDDAFVIATSGQFPPEIQKMARAMVDQSQGYAHAWDDLENMGALAVIERNPSRYLLMPGDLESYRARLDRRGGGGAAVPTDQEIEAEGAVESDWEQKSGGAR